MKLFRGQVVHVEATVMNPVPDHDGDIEILLRPQWSAYVPSEKIIHAEPAPLAVGDLVTWGHGVLNCTILHIDDGVAFIKCEDGVRDLHAIADLRRAG